MDRYVYDIGANIYLLFPDRAALRVTDSNIVAGKAYLTISLEMVGWQDDPMAPTPNRTIVVLNGELQVVRPHDPRVYRFRFVKKEGLSGSFTMVCDAEKWPSIKNDITSQPAYLDVKYKGTSEEFWSERAVATLNLTPNDIIELSRVRTLFAQLKVLQGWMADRSSMGGSDLEDWLQQVVDRRIPVIVSAGHHALSLPHGGIQLSFVKKMEVVISIGGGAQEVRPVWVE